MTVVTIGAFATRLRRTPLTDTKWLPVVLLAIFGSALLYHVMLDVANAGNTGTSGWYLHILMPWAAPALGVGIIALLEQTRWRLLFVGLASYALMFQVVALWAQIALFTGCATKGDDKYYVFPGHTFALTRRPACLIA
jgi:hypothetical protein